MGIGLRAWILRRDPGLIAVRRAGRVTVVACLGFYVCYYLVSDAVMATYALFSAVAMGFLSQIPGPSSRRSLTLLWSLPVALLLVTVGTMLAGNLWAATAGILAFGFVIAYSAAGGPLLGGLGTGMQLFFILACFPPYAPDTLISRLIGVCVGLGLLSLAELTLWPDRHPMSVEALLANASDELAEDLAARSSSDPNAPATTLLTPGWPAEAAWPSQLPPPARPTSASRRDRALCDAGSVLSFVLARWRELPSGADVPLAVAALLNTTAHTSRSTAQALRGGLPPDTFELEDAVSAVQRSRGERTRAEGPEQIRMTTLSLAIAVGVWTMATAVRVVVGAPIECSHEPRWVRSDQFSYAYASSARLWWRRFSAHLTPRSVYFQGAVRVAVALAAARLVAGLFDLSHGFWALLATLTLLRSRAADTRIALLPTVVGTVVGAAVVGAVLIEVGARPDIYAAITPPIMVLAFAAGALIGPAWGQAGFTVFVALVFTQLARTGPEIAEVRVVDVFVGALIGITAGLLAWPRGASGEMRRSAGRFLAAGGDAVEETSQILIASPHQIDPAAGAMPRVREAMALADAAYGTYQTERQQRADSTVDWQAVMTAGHHIVRGSDLLRDLYEPGALARWRPLVDDSASKVHDACDVLATAMYEGREPRIAPMALASAPDIQVVDIQTWLEGVAHDLTRLSAKTR